MEEKLNRLVTDVEVIKIKLETLTSKQEVKLEDHETRIRCLEDSHNQEKGRRFVTGLLNSAVIAVIVGVIVKLF